MPGARRAERLSLTGHPRYLRTATRSSSRLGPRSKSRRERRKRIQAVMSRAEGRGGLREMPAEWEER